MFEDDSPAITASLLTQPGDDRERTAAPALTACAAHLSTVLYIYISVSVGVGRDDDHSLSIMCFSGGHLLGSP
jgi:hypothetical protein